MKIILFFKKNNISHSDLFLRNMCEFKVIDYGALKITNNISGYKEFFHFCNAFITTWSKYKNFQRLTKSELEILTFLI